MTIWNLIHNNPRMFRYWFQEADLEISEKRLLQAFYLYKQNKKEECLDLIAERRLPSQFCEAIRLYLKGLVQNQYCHYKHAIQNLEESVKILSELEDDFVFNPLILLVSVYGNRKETEQMKRCLDKASNIKLTKSLSHCQLAYAKSCYFTIQNDLATVEEVIEQTKQKYPADFIIFEPHFLICKIMLYVHREQFEDCYKTLKEYKKCRGTVSKVNQVYIKALLDLITRGQPIYLYPKSLEAFPEMYQQIQVIKALKSGDRAEAEKFWNQLQSHNPSFYYNDFKTKNDKSLFTIALSLYRNNIGHVSISRERLQHCKTNIEKIKLIFEESSGAVPHDLLIKLIWNEEYSEISYQKLRKLASQFTKNYQIRLKSSQGSYQILKRAS